MRHDEPIGRPTRKGWRCGELRHCCVVQTTDRTDRPPSGVISGLGQGCSPSLGSKNSAPWSLCTPEDCEDAAWHSLFKAPLGPGEKSQTRLRTDAGVVGLRRASKGSLGEYLARHHRAWLGIKERSGPILAAASAHQPRRPATEINASSNSRQLRWVSTGVCSSHPACNVARLWPSPCRYAATRAAGFAGGDEPG